MKTLSIFLTVGCSFFASQAFGSGFTTEELHKSSKVATETFKAEYGDSFHDAIYGIQTTKRNDGSRIKLFYMKGGQAASIEYFCHFHHDSQLDCHEL
jgi:hypothetical protein